MMVTLDIHHGVDIAHPLFWVDNQDHSPKLFTVLTEESVLTGQWQTRAMA